MKIIIIGAGEIGFHIAEKLSSEKIDVVIIESDAERLKNIEEYIDAQFIHGSGSSPDILKKAGIQQAGMVIAVSNQDEVNLVACLVANHYSPGSVKIARVRNPSFLSSKEVFEGLKFDMFINPEYEAAEKLARLIEVPQAVDMIPFAGGKLLLAGFVVQKDSAFVNRKLMELGGLSKNYQPLVAAIYRGSRVIVPRGDDVLKQGDIVYFSVEPKDMHFLIGMVGKKEREIKSVMIYGGSNTGVYLAQKLEEKGKDVKIIESSEKRCTEIADQLTRTTVLHGEAIDKDLLVQENISRMDVFVATSKDTPDNILATLLAKSTGARFTMTLIDRPDYSHLISNLGIGASVSPQLTAVSRIVQFLRRGHVANLEAVREKSAEGIEFVALETSDAVGRPIMDIKFPKGSMVMAVVREETVIIPRGDTVIEPQDRVIIFAKRGAIPVVEKLFAVKLEYF